MKAVIRSIVDKGEFFEPHQYFAKNIVVGFARLNNRSIGIIANQPTRAGGLPGHQCLGQGHPVYTVL